MIISNSSSNKLIRYPTLSYALSFFSQPSSSSSISETLNPSSFPYSNHPLGSRFSYAFSTGLTSDICTPPHSSNSDVFRFNASSIDSICCAGLIKPVFSRFRWFSGSSSDGNLCPVPLKDGKNSEFKDVVIGGFDEPAEKEKKIDRFESNIIPKQVPIIIELIRSVEDDLASKLNSIILSLSVQSINEIFRVVNCEKISALNFFQWAVHRNPELYRNYDVCSLIIDNCCWLNDYKTMVYMLEEFKKKRICLTEKAFGFLTVLISSKASVEEPIRRVVEVLKQVGGSCNGSGVCALINMLCELESFEMAKFVTEITENKVSYYHILIRQRCKRSQIEEAKALIREMRESGCDPNTKTYNYLLGCLFKNNKLLEAQGVVEEMHETGNSPDALTLEMFALYNCKLGKLDVASELLVQMESINQKPRHMAHAAFIKGFFKLKQYEKALEYVHSLSEKGDQSVNMIYSLLAELHQKKGNIIIAESILNEMMDKGLKPNFPVYFKTMKMLKRTGRGNLALRLKYNFAKFIV